MCNTKFNANNLFNNWIEFLKNCSLIYIPLTDICHINFWHSMRPAWGSFKILSLTFFDCGFKFQTKLILVHSIWRWEPSLKPFTEKFMMSYPYNYSPNLICLHLLVGIVWDSLFPVEWLRLTSFDWSRLFATMCRCRCSLTIVSWYCIVTKQGLSLFWQLWGKFIIMLLLKRRIVFSSPAYSVLWQVWSSVPFYLVL